MTSLRRYSAPVAGSIPPSKQRFVPKDGTYPKGFLASGTHVGVKPSNSRRPDLALIVSESPCSAAAVFTRNHFQAAPVVVSKDTLQATGGRDVRALVVNSGCANAVTGKGGLEDAAAMRKAVEDCMAGDAGRESSPGRALVMSTGVIGQRYRCPLPSMLEIFQACSNAGLGCQFRRLCPEYLWHTATYPRIMRPGCRPQQRYARLIRSRSSHPGSSVFLRRQTGHTVSPA